MAPSGWGFQVTECPHPGEDEVEGTCGKFLGARAVYSTRSFPSHFVRYNSHMASPLGLLAPQTRQFKHQKFIICQFWSLEVQIKVLTGLVPDQAVMESLFHAPCSHLIASSGLQAIFDVP